MLFRKLMHNLPAKFRLRAHHLQLVLFAACSFTYTATFWMILSFLPVHLKELNFTDTDIGMIVGAYSISALILMIPLGVLSDGINPKRVLMAGAVVAWAHIAGLQNAGTLWSFLALAALGGLAWAVFQIVLYALYLKVISDENRGKKIALYQAGQFLGYGVGPLLAGFLWDQVGYARSLNLAIAGGVFLNLCIFALPRADAIRLDWRGYRQDLCRGKALLFLGIYFIFATHFGVEQSSYTLFMRKELTFSPREIGFVFFAAGVWMTALSPLAGHRFDVRHNLFQLLMFGLLLSAVFQMCTAWVHGVTGMILVRTLHTLGDTPAILAIGIMNAAFFPRGRMGGNSAVIYTVRVLGVGAGTLAAGLLAPVLGYGGTFVYNGAFILLASLCLLPLMQREFTATREAKWAQGQTS
jgi:MFS family permease